MILSELQPVLFSLPASELRRILGQVSELAGLLCSRIPAWRGSSAATAGRPQASARQELDERVCPEHPRARRCASLLI